MTTRNHPLMSVVVCSYNGQTVIGRAIESLLNQDYPKNRYEIIVVDDGSTDQTAKIAGSYPVKLISHAKNKGLSVARNTGLAAVKGEVYVGFDDDCVATQNWLSEIAKSYNLSSVAGIGSIIAPPQKLHGITDRYMAAIGSGNPPSIKLDPHQSPVKRFTGYIRQQLQLDKSSGIVPVRQLNGATASFPVTILRTVGGWDTQLSGVEDSDLCARISKQYPNHTFYASTTAILTHEPELSLKQLLLRQLKRGGVNLAYYRRNNLIPPIFPFPIIWALALVAFLCVLPVPIAIIINLLLPILLYFWWPIRALRERKLHYLLLPYVQLSEELSGLIGLGRGYLNAVGKTK